MEKVQSTQPRAFDFRYRSANYHAVHSLDSLVMRGVIASWTYAPAENLFRVETHARGGYGVVLTGKEVATFETGAIAVINAINVNGLTVEEIERGLAEKKEA